MIHLLLKSKPLSQIVLITDALYPAKTDLSQSPELYLDKCFYRKSDNVIAGSAMTMIDSIKNLVSWGLPIEHAVRMCSANPAQILKIQNKGIISKGIAETYGGTEFIKQYQKTILIDGLRYNDLASIKNLINIYDAFTSFAATKFAV